MLNADLKQAVKAKSLISGNNKVLLTDVVLVETIWTLKGRKYQLDREALISVIQALFKEPNIRFENGQVVWMALNDYRQAKPIKGKLADFSDALIVNKARYVAEIQSMNLDDVYTFDVAAQQLTGMKAP